MSGPDETVLRVDDEAILRLGRRVKARLADEATARRGSEALARVAREAIIPLGNEAIARLGREVILPLGNEAAAQLGRRAIGQFGQVSAPIRRRQAIVRNLTRRARVDALAWIDERRLLVVGWLRGADADGPDGPLSLTGRAGPLEVLFSVPCARPDVSRAGPRPGRVLLARIPAAEPAWTLSGDLVVHGAGGRWSFSSSDLGRATTDLGTVLRRNLAGLAAEERARLLELLYRSLSEPSPGANPFTISQQLCAARDILRAPAQPSPAGAGGPRGINVDAIMALDERAFYIRGWMRDDEAPIVRLTAVSPEGSRTELLDRLFRHPRPDVERLYGTTADCAQGARPGYIGCFELPASSFASHGWLVEMENAAGAVIEARGPALVRDADQIRDAILADRLHERPPSDELTARQIYPAMGHLQRRRQPAEPVESIAQFGRPLTGPRVSLVIPLYRRIDFVEHQLAQFVHDPEIAAADLVYVLDSPELASDLHNLASQLFELYRLPFRIVTLVRNCGYAVANNVGASLANGRLLLLLNSDILPDRPGWLDTMVRFYDAQLRIGALGPKLLYEDDSLQHAGMYFRRSPTSALWQNTHYFKGHDRCLPAANVARLVPAVTGACLMIDRDLFERVGALNSTYVLGDYEDSDLCLRLIEAGHQNWYLPDVELYHLEGQSYPSAARQAAARYNEWVHTRLWDERIEAIMTELTPVLGRTN